MISRRAKNMEPSMTAVVKSKVADYKSRGVDIISMNVGEADFNTPENIKEAGIAAIQANHTRYTPTAGLNQLKELIAEKLLKENHASYDKSEICVTTGAKLAVYNTIFAMCDEQDEVIIPTPCYVSYVDMVKLADAKPVLVETDLTNGFQLDVAKLEAAVTDRTKVILINNPNNPTGAVYSRESLEALADLAVRKNLYILSDDVYERFVYDGAEYVCIASLNEEIKKRTVVINGFSKGFNMTGWRIGYAAGPKKIIKTITSLQGHMTSNTNTISQWAACEALVGERETIENMVKEFQNRRDAVYEKLVQLEGVTCQKPEGAFYLFPDVSSYYGKKYENYIINDSNDMVEFLIDYAHVSLIPGSAFRSPRNIRIAYSNSQEMLNEGMDRIEKALKLLK